MQKKLEAIPPAGYIIPLKIRKLQLESLIKTKKVAIERSKVSSVQGHIRIVPHYNKLQYYLISEKGDSSGKYLPREQNNFAQALIKLDYDRKVLSSMKKELAYIIKLLQFAEKSACEHIFTRFSKHRKKLVTPVTLADGDFIKEWESVKYEGNNYEFSNEYYTSKGEKVRSKSEVIIADTLARLKVPYRYEYPLELQKQNRVIYPDFCCLNVRGRREFYWEHFGMMDNPEYAANAVAKINSLASSGFHAGANIIYTFETESCPLNVKLVEKMISGMLDPA